LRTTEKFENRPLEPAIPFSRFEDGSFHLFCDVFCDVTLRFCALRKSIERFPLRFDSDMRVMSQHQAAIHEVNSKRPEAMLTVQVVGSMGDEVGTFSGISG
jgi:hypothetical protein